IKVVLCKASDYLPILSGVIYNLSQKIVNTDLVIPYRKLLSHKPISTTAFYDKNDSAVYLHSGGTTGDPKTVMLSCYAFNELAQDLYEVIGGSAPEDNASLMVLPLFHGFGLGVCMHTVLSYGMKTVLIPRFNAREVAKEVKRRRVTFCAGVPLMYDKLNRLCEKDFAKLKTLRFMFCGGDKLTEELKKSFDNHLKAVGDNYEILEGYGLTETVNVCTVNKQGYCVNSCVGYPLRNIEINILSEDGRALPVGEKGEIAVRSETIMLGYLGGSKVENIIDRDGAKWLLTGDVGYLDKEGRLYFCDRIKRTFKVNGVNVYPSEIEQVLSGIDIVKECFVSKFVGAGKEGVKAYVSLRKDVLEERDAKKKILSVCAEKLIKYAVPREIIFMERLPRTPVGKIDSAKLS
ncbi:MAG: class I adenylate-forming enzyme family protein, partial [Clostridia bacterium]